MTGEPTDPLDFPREYGFTEREIRAAFRDPKNHSARRQEVVQWLRAERYAEALRVARSRIADNES